MFWQPAVTSLARHDAHLDEPEQSVATHPRVWLASDCYLKD